MMVVEISATSHFTQNFALYKMGSLEWNFSRDFVYLKTVGFNNLTHSQRLLVMKILKGGAPDAELSGLYGSLITKFSASNVVGENLKIKVGQ